MSWEIKLTADFSVNKHIIYLNKHFLLAMMDYQTSSNEEYTYEKFLETIAHEISHCIIYDLYSESKGHNGKHKVIAEELKNYLLTDKIMSNAEGKTEQKNITSATVSKIIQNYNQKCLVSIQKENSRQHSENFLTHLQQMLAKTNHNLKEIKVIYFTSTPSGQTGIRVALAFLATLQILNPEVKLYHINTLLLQARAENCISLLTIDSRGNKYHVAVFQNKKCLLETQIISQEELEKILRKFPDFSCKKDCQNIDFLTNFQELKGDFVRLNKIEEINY
ncbi:14220_t:CDS:2 [Gigaspora margarita]|uniref:14220_t:CDS:1 n=1 Tax=Gigaspora margarita TaxID=4874 RepID=A0ABN7UMH9_GIGMA|nr:14220_t:CDS:2 [Gigaspora margarita]